MHPLKYLMLEQNNEVLQIECLVFQSQAVLPKICKTISIHRIRL
jgi:hypothetical protein